uniref:RNA polymerase II elongation factor ELL n=1 Tax=Phallusia mammillata TaxID=59560 RepID=A0A6F9DCN3_9ASCI|nr:RNA polymerase II elongation factor ELL [Phallusia mammillata]
MAIELKEGDYALQQNNAKKIVLQFKLTDSALRAIEDFQESGGRNGRPNIRFDGNQGSIQIPGTSEGEAQNFKFQFASLNQSAAIDCLQQYKTRDPVGRISVLGAIQHKITVNATDDSYNATRKRMTLVKEQEQKTSTKVIKQPSSSKLGKNKTVRRVIDQQARSTSFTHGRTATPPPSRHTTNLPYNRSLSPHTASHRSESPVSSSGDLAGVRNKTKPVLSSLTSSSTTSSQQNFSNSGKSLDETVIHLLAPRPLKHQELVVRLNRYGATPDRTKLQNVLQQVSTSRTVGKGEQEYSLNKSMYNEVKADWQGYTDDERSAVRRKLAEIKIGASENRKRPLQVSDPAKSKPEFPGLSPKNRQAEDEANYTNPVRKKARVSYYHKTSPTSGGRPRSVSPLETGGILSLNPTSVSTISSSSIVNLDDSDAGAFGLGNERPSPKKPRVDNRRSPLVTPPLEGSIPEPDARTNTATEKAKNGEISPLRPIQRTSKSRNRRLDNDQQRQPQHTERRDEKNSIRSIGKAESDERTNEGDEFVRKYKAINYSEQRNQYKKDFCAEYKEYLRLHEKVAGQTKRFADWQKQINQEEKGTAQYKSIALKVLDEYKKLKKDDAYRKDYDRFQYLHRKLKHIKDLVLDYDRREATR